MKRGLERNGKELRAAATMLSVARSEIGGGPRRVRPAIGGTETARKGEGRPPGLLAGSGEGRPPPGDVGLYAGSGEGSSGLRGWSGVRFR